MIIRGCFENMADQSLLNNKDFIKMGRGGIAQNFYSVYNLLYAKAL